MGAAGRVLAGRYRILEPLARGGMGSIWRAEHIELGTPAAVKLIDPAIMGSPEALARFKREAQAAASLRGTHVVQILDYGVDEGSPFIAMELLEGESLAARLTRVERLSPSETACILSQVGKGVSRAHERGIVHRDLKPDNIFLVREGEDEVVKVLDFGIAKASAILGGSGIATRTGTLMGTPYYMSPEQASGKRQVDHRTDIWSLGVMAFQCLTGQLPFQGDTVGALVLAICVEPLPAPSLFGSVLPGLDQWMARALERDPDRRFSSVGEAMAELNALCGDRSSRPSGQAYERSPLVAVPARTAPQQEIGAPLYTETAAPASVTVSKSLRSSALPWVAGIAATLVVAGLLAAVAVQRSGPIDVQPSSTLLAIPAASPAPAASQAQAAQPPLAVEPHLDPEAALAPSASKPERSESRNQQRGWPAPSAVAPKSSAAPPASASPAPSRRPSLERRLGF